MSYIPVHTTLAGLKMTDAQREALTNFATRYDSYTRLHHINVVTGHAMSLPDSYIGFEFYSAERYENGEHKFTLEGGIDSEGQIST